MGLSKDTIAASALLKSRGYNPFEVLSEELGPEGYHAVRRSTLGFPIFTPDMLGYQIELREWNDPQDWEDLKEFL